MATVEASIEAALFARAASLVLSPVHPVAWPNVTFTPPADRRYIRVTHFVNTTERLFISDTAPHRHQGILQMMVCGPLNSGEAAVRELAGLVANHFSPSLRLTSGGCTVRITKRANVATSLVTDTEIQVPVSIAYECFA